ncbi:MAG: dockerin type I repeat-containing protein [Ruminococcus sp.]|nr:dockerin type I repeat-containing protein [Ruminococcus sp.]
MKKLISAASALTMAASMVGAAVPFATGAADSTKGFELRAFENRAGEAVSTTISADEIAAGDVTIPIGVYLLENTADSESIKAEWTVSSADGDASNTYVTFKGAQHSDDYYDAEREVTIGGKTASTKKYVPFAGTIKGGKVTLTAGKSLFSTALKQDSSKCPNAWGSLMWTPVSGKPYEWSGETSDAYPMFVFEATFAKGTPAGTYTIDFVDIIKDENFPENRSSMIESPAGKMTSANKNLTFKGIEIKIGDSEGPKDTTTTAPVTTADKPQTTTTTDSSNISEFEMIDDFIINVPDIELEPGESKEVSFTVENPGKHKAATLSAFLAKVTDGVTVALNEEDNPFCEAVPGDKEWIHSGKVELCDTVDSDKSRPQDVTDGPIISVIVTADATAEPGVYDYGLDRFHLVENAQEGNVQEYDVKVNNGKLTIKGEPKNTTTTDKVTTTTDKVITTTSTNTTVTTTDKVTTTTQKPTQAGDPHYGDTNCDGKVNIADVVLLNKWLNDAKSYAITDQGKLNADCCDPKAGEGLDASDSDAIIKRIVHLVELPCEVADLK